MEYGINLMSVIPVRSAPEDPSEQVTQLLFGELVMILEKRDKWLMVQVVSDSYQGWVSAGQITKISYEEFVALQGKPHWVSNDLIQLLENKTRRYSFMISAGSSFYDSSQNAFNLCGEEWYYHGTMSPTKTFEPEELVNHAMIFLHTPYMWGGKSALGADCSGFTQVVFKMAGKIIHRDASQQARQGETINLIHEARIGDLLFFDNQEGDIIHVGIMLDENHIIHAHHKVRIDKVDHHGIFNTDTRKYTHQLRLIKRYSK